MTRFIKKGTIGDYLKEGLVADDFYTELEKAFRGSRLLIKERLAVYFPLLQVIDRMGIPVSALDLGCGRGEWLEVLKEHDIGATGVDLDFHMLAMARNTGQATVQSDALEYLKTQPDDSLVLVSAFHLVEHLPFEGITDLITQALRVLVPGGMLLMETPNPENMVVASWKFYLDPTHQRPVPPLLLSFLSRHAGFFRTRAMGLNPPDPPTGNNCVSLRQVLEGMGSDYAVVAQKPGDSFITAHADDFFCDRSFPSPSQEEFVAAYDAGINEYRTTITEQSQHIKEMNVRIKEMSVRVNEVKTGSSKRLRPPERSCMQFVPALPGGLPGLCVH